MTNVIRPSDGRHQPTSSHPAGWLRYHPRTAQSTAPARAGGYPAGVRRFLPRNRH